MEEGGFQEEDMRQPLQGEVRQNHHHRLLRMLRVDHMMIMGTLVALVALSVSSRTMGIPLGPGTLAGSRGISDMCCNVFGQ